MNLETYFSILIKDYFVVCRFCFSTYVFLQRGIGKRKEKNFSEFI